jgi:hypothetical protein
VRRVAAGLALLLPCVAVAGCGGGAPDRRAAVNAYVVEVNRIEARSAPAFGAADTAMRRFNVSPPPRDQDRRLTAAVVAISAAGVSLRRLDPPPEARQLHRDLLLLYTRQARLAQEVRGFARFLTAAQHTLARAQRRVAGRAGSAGRQLTAEAVVRHADTVRATAAELAGLVPPPALRPWRADQVRWLRAVATEARRLATALRARDAAAAEVLAVRYRAVAAASPGVTAAQRHALLAYNARVRAISLLRERIASVQVALDRKLR